MNLPPAVSPVDPSEPSDTPLLASDRHPTHVVGIGASAGGLEALERFFEKVPAKTGMAFVVVQHLSPDFKSLTDELLARRTALTIYRVQDGMVVERDAMYLIPPKKDMIISNGRLLLTDKDPAQLVALPIDHFFRSLAQDAGDRAIGIVLSGTGSDGSRGICDIHEAGGLVIVQTPESAKFDGMPRTALKTGAVDFTLPPEQIPGALLNYIEHPLASEPSELRSVEESETSVDAVYRLLRDSYGIDFAHYRPSTVARRTERRLLLSNTSGLDEYALRLKNDPEELNALYKDLLIGVTRLFRDQEAFDHLETQVLPSLLKQARPEDELRVWVAGCATGEEAYSLAILFREANERLPRPVSVKLFATDVHRTSLETASAGIYSEASLMDLSPERLQRHFIDRGDAYQVTPEIRKMVVFAHHNVIKDAPFTKLDLVSCRNLLIYFQPGAQRKVLSMFHFGLKTGGILFLGPSESPGELTEEFDTLEGRLKIFRKRRDVRLPTDIRLTAAVSSGGRRAAPGAPGSPQSDSQLIGTYDTLLDEHMPPSLLVGERRELVQSFGGANRYLRMKDGRFSTDVLELVDPELRMVLTSALQRVFANGRPALYKGLRIRVLNPGTAGVAASEADQLINLSVKQVKSRRSDLVHALVQFEELGTPPTPSEPVPEVDLTLASREHLISLESELRYTRENLQATIEELETSNEELQATNEELLAANEELQSTNEELHSVNEELHTVNAEYQKKITELTELTTDMDNLLLSTQVHTIFLDLNLCIRKFTPKIAETFNLLPHDVGRRIDSFTHTIDYPNLQEDVQTVLRTSLPLERQVRDQRGRWFLLRVLPYRAGLGIEGVVLTLVDISNLKQVEAEARQKDQQLAAILKNSPSLVFIKDLRGRYLLTDEPFTRVAGCNPIGKTAYDFFPRETADLLTAQDQQVLAEGALVEQEVVIAHADGPHTYLAVKFPLRDEDGRINSIGGIKTDVTALKSAESRAVEALAQRDRFLAILSHELRNPLAALLNAGALIQASGPLPPAVAEWFQIIDRRSRHMARLLDDLLDVARITQNKIEIRAHLFDLVTTVADVVEEASPRLEQDGVELIVHQPDGPLPVVGDPARLQQAQVNLLLNASKYTPRQGRIWYSLARDREEAVVRIRDTGIGIDPALVEKMFDLFVQADNALDRSGGGIGVGLTLVRALVELHGGRVTAQSEGRGKGSEFVIRLPLAPGPLPPTVVAAPTVARVGRPIRSQRLLVVEDDADIRELLQAMLEREGYTVRVEANGLTGLAAAETDVPDVVLVDIGLPGLDGYELARRLRKRFGPERIRLVALTGYGQGADRARALEAGFDIHLTKPLKATALFGLLESFWIAESTQPRPTPPQDGK